MSLFKKAERKQAKLKLAITGPSGSGKTYSSLLIASGIGKKIALIDTENCSASLYAGQEGIPEFDVIEIEPPYTSEKYTQAIQAAQKEGYDVLVIDSLTHAWAGDGGLLDQKETLDARGRGNSYTNWATITKQHEQFKSLILSSDIHIIGTMRSKQDYVQVEENGKKTIKKLGMAPIQRDGIEYEFTCVLDLAMNHTAESSKDRTRLFDGKVFKPSKQTGIDLSNWLLTGSTPVVTPKQLDPQVATTDPNTSMWSPGVNERKELDAIVQSGRWSWEQITRYLDDRFKVQRVSLLDASQYGQLKQTMEMTTGEAALYGGVK